MAGALGCGWGWAGGVLGCGAAGSPDWGVTGALGCGSLGCWGCAAGAVAGGAVLGSDGAGPASAGVSGADRFSGVDSIGVSDSWVKFSASPGAGLVGELSPPAASGVLGALLSDPTAGGAAG